MVDSWISVIIIFSVFLILNIFLVLAALKHKQKLEYCIHAESPYCLTVACNDDDGSTASEGSKKCQNHPYRLMTDGPNKGEIQCNFPGTMVPAQTKSSS